MSVKTFLQVWGIIPSESKTCPPRYSQEWQEWHNDQIDQTVAMAVSSSPKSDDYFRDRAAQIEDMPAGQRHDAYELLLTAIANNHPYGYAADIYDEIAQLANQNSLR